MKTIAGKETGKMSFALKLLCCLGVIALAVCIMAPSAFAKVTDDIAVEKDGKHDPTASQVNGVKTLKDSHISKVVWSAADAKFSKEFNFTFTAVSENGHTAGTAEADMPNLSAQTITVTQANKVSTSTDGSSSAYTVNKDFTWLKTGTATAQDTFSHAGEYVYTIKETTAAATDWTHSQAEYTLRVYVANETSGIAIKGITTNRNNADDGTTVDEDDYKYDTEGKGSGVDSKTDPSDPNDPEDGDKWNALAGLEFLSVHEAHSDLTISMEVAGDYGSHTLEFLYSGKLTRAAYTEKYDTTKTFTGVLVDAKGTPKQAIDFTYGTAANFKLIHGQKIVFDGITAYSGKTSTKLAAGTMYGYTQTGNTGYSNNTKTVESMDTNAVESTGTEKGKNLSVTYATATDVKNPQDVKAVTAKIGQNTGNYSEVVNILDIM